LILIFVGAATLARAQSRALQVIGGLLVGAVLLQIGIGMSMVHFGMPLALATMHNAGAALLVICAVTLLRLLWTELPARAEPAARAEAAARAVP
jgi:cytochrome c oxidase assembly protein subunit 15